MKLLNEMGPVLEGTLTEVKRICGNKNCRCRKDKDSRHPALYLTWKEKKKTQALYIPKSMWTEAKQWNANYKNAKKLIKEISEIQKELLKQR